MYEEDIINKKVRNAKEIWYKGIKFKSALEADCFKMLEEAGFTPEYETKVFNLLNKFRLDKVVYYCPFKCKKHRIFGTYPRMIMDITYTPDFYITHKGVHILFDTKGYPNDVYPLKKKLFLKQLETISTTTGETYMFFEPHNKEQIRSSISIILSL